MAFNKAKAMQEAEKLVSQRKIADAIKQYSRILEKDPSDISILNTIGDLQYRENNKAEALQNFNKLADAFMKDGFTVKAIAIYRKISKIDPNQVEPFLKLAELYILQGLSREAREQYAHAVDYFKKHNQPDRALETFRKIVALDPENRTFRTRLAELAEQLGRKEEAGLAYVEVAEGAVRAGEVPAAETALKKALEIDPKSEQAHLLRARLALSKRDYGQVEKILDSVPALKEAPPGRQLLIEAYLETQKAESAEKLVLSAFQANPDDFSPLASFASLCAEKGDLDAALAPLQQAADTVIEHKGAAPLMETLRHIWSKHPQHIPTLQLAVQVAEKTSDELTLVEALSALGRAFEQAGELQEAEEAYQKLVKREPGNEDYRNALQQVMEKQGKKAALPSPVLAEIDLSTLGEEVVAAPAPPAEDAEQAAMVKEALDNSDLFSRYGLVDKAVGELEKVLAVYPEQVDIHRRIFEVCHRTQPERATKAAEALVEIFRMHGDLESAHKYEEVVGQVASGAEVALPVGAPAPAVEEAPEPVEAGPVEVDLTEVFPVTAPAEPAPEEAPAAEPVEIPLELSAPVGAPAAPAAPEELDLSTDLEAFTAPAEPVAAPVAERPPAAFDYQEAREEIEFYLSQNLQDEARNAVQVLEERFPGDPQVAELRQYVEAQAAAPAPPAEVVPAEEAPLEAPVSAGAELAAPPEVSVEPSPVELAPEITPEAVGPSPPEVLPTFPEPSPPAFGGPPPAPPSAPPPMEAPAAGGDLLGSLVGDLEAGLEGFGDLGAPAAGQGAPPESALGRDAESPLSGLLDELGEGGAAQATQDDPETHYNLGVAFREMGLLDEAIGEFQKVVKGAQKGSFPPNFLQACSLLAVSFMDKGMPAIAVKWYVRALEFPGLDEESTMSLQYDLGVAYEQAGDTRTALEKFSEVYSQNIDFRDVAEKIRTLQQKAH
jgi:tetratricopeptide (TPR) repeat protein